jgi:uncharacterized membrane protein
MKHAPTLLGDIKKAVAPVVDVNKVHRERLSVLEKFALAVTKKVGTMGFFLIIFVWTFLWITWNTIGPREFRFDPFPAFELWIIISNIIQLSLLPLIMVGQNLMNKHAEARAEADFGLNVRTEKEIEAILMHLENQNEMLLELLKKKNAKK